jgi:hypothetical protein
LRTFSSTFSNKSCSAFGPTAQHTVRTINAKLPEGMGLTDGNVVSDFPALDFAIRLFCYACRHPANLDREHVPADTPIQDVTRRLRCAACGSRECSIRIIYAGAGGFRR